MKKRLSLTLLLTVAVAFAAQLMQRLFGFEAETGLALHGVWFLVPILAMLALWAAAVRAVPEDSPGFPAAFALTKNQLFLPVAGVFLMALAGLGYLAAGLLPSTGTVISGDGMISTVVMGSLSPASSILLGVTTLVPALCLFPALLACFRQTPCSFQLLLAVPVLLVVRLVSIYRIHSVSPVLADYAVELLAMMALSLAFYRLSGFACGAGSTRRFALYGGWAVILSLAALPGQGFPDALFYLGGGLTLLGLLRRDTPSI